MRNADSKQLIIGEKTTGFLMGESAMALTDLTTLLLAWGAGDQEAAAQIAEIVYFDLRRRAAAHLSRHNGYQMLSATALVNETYLRLLGGAQVEWKCTAHFFVVASNQMRRILIDGIRKSMVRKKARGEQIWREEERFRRASVESEWTREIDLLALDEALTKLAEESSRAAQIVELRYFGGLTEEETARIVGISVSQLKRDWKWAKARLYGLMSELEVSSTRM
jgi:RNA polymerase sigma factor (TIGR02999 family)